MRTLLQGITALVLIVTIPHVFCNEYEVRERERDGHPDGGPGTAYNKVANGDIKAIVELESPISDEGAGSAYNKGEMGDLDALIKGSSIHKYLIPVHNLLNGVKTADDVKKMLPDINTLRRKLAKAANISNMAKLTWDADLAKKASSNDCQDLTGANFRSFKFHTSLRTEPFLLSQYGKVELTTEELFAPHQNLIGCAQKGCMPLQQDNKDMKKFEYVCVMGPSAIKAENVETRGAPGSNCGKGKNDDGLCDMGMASGASSGASSESSGASRASSEAPSSNQTVTSSSTDHFISSALLISSLLVF